jgi:hypothetical protein
LVLLDKPLKLAKTVKQKQPSVKKFLRFFLDSQEYEIVISFGGK